MHEKKIANPQNIIYIEYIVHPINKYLFTFYSFGDLGLVL